ncbi:unnamed protein product [Brassicogethes aeneus]|uniref:C2H2-type domain-containing protein n=1 Tax=Brassicogethes aeneus TaxID=1431903 RepID=A0A9P0AW94_BRAAE|nr:unnamed protein product [Brassicogethes aeneus]
MNQLFCSRDEPITRTSNKVLECPYCSHWTKQKQDLQKHVYTRHREQNDVEKKIEITVVIFSCNKCNFTTVSKESLDIHCSEVCKNLDAPMLTCDHCKFTTNIKIKMQRHLRWHKSNNKCPYCDFITDGITDTARTLQSHIYRKHKEQNELEKKVPITIKTYSCDNCKYSTLTKTCFYSHTISCKKIKLKNTFKCHQCPYKSNTNEKLRKHLTRHAPWIKCLYCEFLSVENRTIYRHIYRKHKQQNDVENKVPLPLETCVYCDFKTMDTRTLQTHIHMKHKEQNNLEKKVPVIIKTFSCENCHYTTVRKTSFLSHTRSCKKIKEENTFKCLQCPYKSNTNQKLKWHQKTHLSPKFFCPYCQRVYKKSSSLQLHVINKHKEQNEQENKVKFTNKFYKCSFCESRYLEKKQVMDHEGKCRERVESPTRTSNEMQYINCPYCSHSTKRKKDLQKHVYMLHQEQNDVEKKIEITCVIYSCDKCNYTTVSKNSLEIHSFKVCKNLNAPILTCEHCRFTTPIRVEPPKRTSNELQYINCPYCSHSTKRKKELQKHVYRLHREQNDVEKKMEITVEPTTNELQYINCPYCSHSTKRKKDLHKHVYRLHREQNDVEKKMEITCEIYSCDKCNYTTVSKNSLEIHSFKVCKNLDAPILTCEHCRVEPTTKTTKLRTKSSNKVADIECPYCSYSTKRKPDLHKHVNRMHREQNDIEKKIEITFLKKNCVYCDFTTMNTRTLQMHVHSKHRKQNELEKKVPITIKTYFCDNCDYSTLSKSSFDSHTISCKKIKLEITFKCHLCPYKSNTNEKLKKHIKGHTPSIKCLYCEFSSVENRTINRHIYRKHKQQNDVENKVQLLLEICVYCDFTTIDTRALQMHVHSKHRKQNELEKKVPITRKTYFCDNCDYSTLSKSSFDWHTISCKKIKVEPTTKTTKLRTKSSNKVADIECPYCSYSTKRKPDLHKHVNRMHREQNDIEKKIEMTCLKKNCVYCDFTTEYTIALQRHIYSKHREQNELEKKVPITLKTYSCDNCDYSTLSKSSFDSHTISCIKIKVEPTTKTTKLRSKSSNKVADIECPYCSYSTKRKQDLHRHVYRMHREQNDIEKEIEITFMKKNCVYCDFTTVETHSLQMHIYSKHREQNELEKKVPITIKTYFCDNCDYSTLSKSYFDSHIISCKKIKVEPTTKTTKLRTKSSNKVADIECPYCSYSTKRKQDLHKHVNRIHREQNDIEKKIEITCLKKNCVYCDFTTVDTRELQMHIYSKHREQNELEKKVPITIKTYSCDNCDYTTVRKSSFYSHTISCKKIKVEPTTKTTKLRTKSSNKVADIECPYCSYSTKRKQDLHKHVNRIHREQNDIEKKIEITCLKKNCVYCDFTTVDTRELQMHIYSKHREQNELEKKVPITIKTYSCDNCDYTTVRKSSFYSHTISCKKIKVEPTTKTSNKVADIECPYCSYSTKRKLDLQKHVYRMHREQNDIEKKIEITCEIYSCDKCNYTTVSKNSLEIHSFKACKSLDPPILTCKHCRFKTTIKFEMQKHLRMHTSNFKCSYCEYTAKTNQKIKRHIYAKHRQQNNEENKVQLIPKKCVYCDFTTVDTQTFQMHIYSKHRTQNELEKKVPITIKTYSCDNCDYTTVRKSSFHSHTISCKKIKLENTLKYHLCPYKSNTNEKLRKHLSRHTPSIKCLYCDFSSVENRRMKSHIYRKHRQQNDVENKVQLLLETCVYCDFTTIDTRALQMHVHNKHRKQNELEKKVPITIKTFFCDNCDYSTVFCFRVEPTSKTSNKVADIECPYCSYSTKRKLDLQKHVYRMHREQNEVEKKIEIKCLMYSCDKCNYTTVSKNCLEIHSFKACKSLDAPILTCKHCRFKTTIKFEMQKHLRMHTSNFKCSYCEYAAKTNQKIKRHIYAKHRQQNDEENKVQLIPKKCVYCDFTTVDTQTFQMHIYSKHRTQNELEKKVPITIKTYSCDNCDYTTVRKSSFHSHTISCKKIKLENTLKCHLCPYKSNTNEKLKKHLSRHTPSIKCLYCHFSSVENRRMKSHIYRKHKQQNDVENKVQLLLETCVYCDFTAIDTRALQMHVHNKHRKQNELERKVPITIKTFFCDNCDYSTVSITCFHSHTKSCKNIKLENTFKCHQCPYKSNTNKELKWHLKTHQSRKFVCPYCQLVYITSRSFQLHVIMKHKEQNEQEYKVKLTNKFYKCSFCELINFEKKKVMAHEDKCKNKKKS